MPKRPPKPCTTPRCKNYATKGSKCDEHQPKAGWSKESRHKRGYGYQWYKTKEAVLKRDKHLCQNCLRQGIFTLGDEVDHIVNKAEGGSDKMSNLETICKKCHKQKTREESKRGRNKRSIQNKPNLDKSE